MIIQSRAKIDSNVSGQGNKRQHNQFSKIPALRRYKNQKLVKNDNAPLSMNYFQQKITSQCENNVQEQFMDTKIDFQRLRRKNVQSSLQQFVRDKKLYLDQSMIKNSSVQHYQKLRKLDKQRKLKGRMQKIASVFNRTQLIIKNNQSCQNQDKNVSYQRGRVTYSQNNRYKAQENPNQYVLFSQYQKTIQQKRQKDRSKAGQNFYIKIKKLQSYDKWKQRYPNQTQNNQSAKNRFFSHINNANMSQTAAQNQEQSPGKQNGENQKSVSKIEQTSNKYFKKEEYVRTSMSQTAQHTDYDKCLMRVSKDSHNIKKINSSQAPRLYKLSNRYKRMNITQKYSNINSKNPYQRQCKAAINSISPNQANLRMESHTDEQFEGKVQNINLIKYENLIYQKGRQTPQRWDVYNNRISNFIERLGISLNN